MAIERVELLSFPLSLTSLTLTSCSVIDCLDELEDVDVEDEDDGLRPLSRLTNLKYLDVTSTGDVSGAFMYICIHVAQSRLPLSLHFPLKPISIVPPFPSPHPSPHAQTAPCA